MNESLFFASATDFPVAHYVDFATLQAALDDSFTTFDLLSVGEIARVDGVFADLLHRATSAKGSAAKEQQMSDAKRLLRFAQLNVAAVVSLGVQRFGSSVFEEVGSMLADSRMLYCTALLKWMAKLDARSDGDAPLSSTVSAAPLADLVFEVLRDQLDALMQNREHPRRAELKAMRAFATSAPNLRIRRRAGDLTSPRTPTAAAAAAAPAPAPAPAVLESVAVASSTIASKPATSARKQSRRNANPSKRWFVKNEDVERGEQLGSGAQGRIVRGRWREMDVAIKEVVDARDVKQFMQEIQLLCGLRPHRHVVTLYAVVLEPPAIVMELCAKGSLADWLATPAGLAAPPLDLLRILDGVASGVSHLHAELVVHGDLAGRNILLSDDGTPKVCDFGFAVRVTAHAGSMTTPGKMPIKWLAPERLLGAQVSTQSDVFSFGVVCSEVLNRLAPFPNVSNEAAARMIVEHGARPAPPPATMNGVDLAWLVAAVRSCWLTEADRRPTMLELCRVFTQHVAASNSARENSTRFDTILEDPYVVMTNDDVFDDDDGDDGNEATDYSGPSESLASSSSSCFEPPQISHRSALMRRESTRLMMTSSSSNSVVSKLLDTPDKKVFLLDFIASERVPADVVFLWRVRLYELIPAHEVAARLSDFRSIVSGPLREVFLLRDIVDELLAALASAQFCGAAPPASVFDRARAFVIAGQAKQFSSAAMASAFASAVLSATIGAEFQLTAQLLDKFQAEGELLSLVGGLKYDGTVGGADWQVLRHVNDSIVCSRTEGNVFGAKATTLMRRDLASVVQYISSLRTRGEWDTTFIEGRVVTEFGPCAAWWSSHRAPGALGAILKKRDVVQLRVIINRDPNTTLLLARSITHRSVAPKVAGHQRADVGLSGFICVYKPELQLTVVTTVLLLNNSELPSYVLRQLALTRGDLLANIRMALQLSDENDDVAQLHAKWFAAATAGQLATLKEVLKDAPMALILRDRSSRLALHCAAGCGNTEVLRWLASNKRSPSIDVPDGEGFTALLTAAANGHVDTCLALLDLGADSSLATTSGKSTPLHYAARISTWSQPLRILLDRLTLAPTAVAARDKSRATPPHMACFRSGVDVVSLLLDRGAAIHAVDQRSESPLHYAVRADDFDVVELLLLRGADRRAQNDAGESPHDVAINENASERIRKRLQT